MAKCSHKAGKEEAHHPRWCLFLHGWRCARTHHPPPDTFACPCTTDRRPRRPSPRPPLPRPTSAHPAAVRPTARPAAAGATPRSARPTTACGRGVPRCGHLAASRGRRRAGLPGRAGPFPAAAGTRGAGGGRGLAAVAEDGFCSRRRRRVHERGQIGAPSTYASERDGLSALRVRLRFFFLKLGPRSGVPASPAPPPTSLPPPARRQCHAACAPGPAVVVGHAARTAAATRSSAAHGTRRVARYS